MENRDVILDFSKSDPKRAHPTYRSAGKARPRIGNSRPTERIYQQRHAWWISKGFSPKYAAWAASFRLGEPKRKTTWSNEVSVNQALLVANAREAHISALVKEKGISKEQAISRLDRRLRNLNIKALMEDKGYSREEAGRKVESNIYRDISP